jgi:hypothetical protein
MLPILRILPVGGVLLAILILVLALTPPGTRPLPLDPTVVSARGPLLDRNEHPEWRQVLIQSALRRADELIRLRDLPDTPVRSEPPAAAVSGPIVPALEQAPPAPTDEQKIAGLPKARLDADPDPDSITGSIDESPGATIPVEIGASSSSELPVVMPEERPPVIRTPVRAKPPNESRRKRTHRITRAKTPRVKPQPPAQLSFFEALFSGQKYEPQAGGGAQTGAANQPPTYRADTH